MTLSDIKKELETTDVIEIVPNAELLREIEEVISDDFSEALRQYKKEGWTLGYDISIFYSNVNGGICNGPLVMEW